MIYLPGGPSHMDMYDLKPDAPAEIRGEYDLVGTNATGVNVRGMEEDDYAVVYGGLSHEERGSKEVPKKSGLGASSRLGSPGL
jgi:hypothetical protein